MEQTRHNAVGGGFLFVVIQRTGAGTNDVADGEGLVLGVVQIFVDFAET
jgi:hypothetical protein